MVFDYQFDYGDETFDYEIDTTDIEDNVNESFDALVEEYGLKELMKLWYENFYSKETLQNIEEDKAYGITDNISCIDNMNEDDMREFVRDGAMFQLEDLPEIESYLKEYYYDKAYKYFLEVMDDYEDISDRIADDDMWRNGNLYK